MSGVRRVYLDVSGVEALRNKLLTAENRVKELEAVEGRVLSKVPPGPGVNERQWRVLSHAKSIGEPSGLRRIRDLEQRVADAESKRREVEAQWQNLSAQYSEMALMRSRGEQRVAVLEEQLFDAKRGREEVGTAFQALAVQVTELRDREADARRRLSELKRELQLSESRTAIAESKEKALYDLNDAQLAQSMVYRDERENALRRVEALKLRVGREEEEILRLKKENQEMHSIVLDQAERRARAEKENQELKVGVGKYVFWLLRDPGIPRALLVIALGWAAWTYFAPD